MSIKVCDHDEPCACYVEGYAQGKDKAHFEVRNASTPATPRIAAASRA